MTSMLAHFLLAVTPIDYSLAYVASSRHTGKGGKTTAQDTSVTKEAITNEVNSKCYNLLSMRLTKLNVASG